MLKALEEKIQLGGNLTKDEAAKVRPITGEMITGMNDMERNSRAQEIDEILENQTNDIVAKIKTANAGISKIRKKEDKDKMNMVINKLLGDAEGLKKQRVQLKSLVANPFQPLPELEEKDVTINRAKVNADVRPDQIRVKLTGSDELKNSGGSYIKIYLPYGDTDKELFEDHMDVDQEEKECMFTAPGQNAVNIIKGLRDREISFSLKKKKMLVYKTNLDT